MTRIAGDGGFTCEICWMWREALAEAQSCEARHQTESVADIIRETQEERLAMLESGVVPCDDVVRQQAMGEPLFASADLPPPLAAELLGRAARHMHDRAATYDKPEGERSMGRTVAAFNAVTGAALTESDGWLFLALVKQVRLFTRAEYHADSAEDGIAYLALLAEARSAGR